MEEREDIIILTDEDGVEREFRHVDTLEYNGIYYVALSPNVYDDGEPEEELEEEVYIMKIVEDGGEEVLEIVDDDEELNEVFAEFQKLDEMEEFEEEDEEQ